MKTRTLGSTGLSASAIGLGCMGMSFAYGGADEAESIRTLHRAVELGVTMFDTAEVYGPYANEELLARALRGLRGKVSIATKFGFRIGAQGRGMHAARCAARATASGRWTWSGCKAHAGLGHDEGHIPSKLARRDSFTLRRALRALFCGVAAHSGASAPDRAAAGRIRRRPRRHAGQQQLAGATRRFAWSG
ncbi:aldo/keto reductase [Massilia antarctica]|uniref:aldo/keto reductase n=1 Tax=Massilia antarctica TaxID=2765360 RepID=UPI0027D99FE3|nr:aldo/keto reductase [Massilia antarctica]